MAKKTTKTAASTEASKGEKAQFKIRGIYIKDLSFENPGVLEAISKQGKPDVSLNFDVTATKLEGSAFEAVLKAEAMAKMDNGKPLFLVELSYAAIIVINPELEAKEAQEVLSKHAPQMLFPYIRQKIAELTREGGFSPLVLEHMEFRAKPKSEAA